MMGKANFVGLVGGGRQPKFASNKASLLTIIPFITRTLLLTLVVQLVLWDDSRNKVALEISALTPVRGVQLSKERVVVVLQNSVRVYRFAKPPSLLTAYETANNPWGLCCLSPRRLAFPGRTTGHVQLVELSSGNVSIIPAHSSAIRALALSSDGELLATASEMVYPPVHPLKPLSSPRLTTTKGTLIRVWATSNCARLAELRRGIDPATIFSLAFNPSATMLACTSDKSTLHIFDVPNPNRPSRPTQQPTALAGVPGIPSAANGAPETAISTTNGSNRGKWGFLAKLPMMPRVFKDVYSFASAPFASDDGASSEGSSTSSRMLGGLPMSESTTLGTSRPPKGIIGWLTDDVLLVVGAGADPRWEKFVVVEGPDGRRGLLRQGWKRYLGTP